MNDNAILLISVKYHLNRPNKVKKITTLWEPKEIIKVSYGLSILVMWYFGIVSISHSLHTLYSVLFDNISKTKVLIIVCSFQSFHTICQII